MEGFSGQNFQENFQNLNNQNPTKTIWKRIYFILSTWKAVLVFAYLETNKIEGKKEIVRKYLKLTILGI